MVGKRVQLALRKSLKIHKLDIEKAKAPEEECFFFFFFQICLCFVFVGLHSILISVVLSFL